METLIFLTILLFIYYIMISKTKNTFITIPNRERNREQQLKLIYDAIELKIKDKHDKKIFLNYYDSLKNEVRDTSSKLGDNSEIYKESPRDSNDVYYTFNISKDNIYYSNILEGCDKKNIVENINNSYSLYSYIIKLIEQLVSYSNKNNNTSFTVINIDRFKRQKKDNKIYYIIEAFLLDYKKFISHKYSFNIEIVDDVINVKNVSIVNTKVPIKRFTCDDSKHCSGRNSSLKITDDIDNVDGINNTQLEHSLTDLKENSQHTNIKNISSLKNHIKLNNEPDRGTFPCRTIHNTWDINGVSSSDNTSKNCHGSNYSLDLRNSTPFYHVSMFSNYNFPEDTINENINDNFKWNNMLGYDVA